MNRRHSTLAEMNMLSVSYLEWMAQEVQHSGSQSDSPWQLFFSNLDTDSGAVDIRNVKGPVGTNPDDSRNGRPEWPRSLVDRLSGGDQLSQLVWAYRAWGHLAAHVDPLGLHGVGESYWAELYPAHQLNELQTDSRVYGDTTNAPHTDMQVDRLRDLYCRSIGYQFMHVQDLAIRDWFIQQVEGSESRITATPAAQRRLLQQLVRADAFEQFVRKKFPGAKVFSIDGSECLVPLLDWLLLGAAEFNTKTVVLGMAHRGRLNVLTNVFNRGPANLFRSLEDRLPPGPHGHGDVRYHLGDDTSWTAPNGHVLRLSMCFNPSHLEYVNPVAMGRSRALQDQEPQHDRQRLLTILIHGDAAFAGEGIVYESLNLSRLPAYDVGGVIHIVINNQIGFTTPPAENRATTYATDLARAVQLPVLHVNGEDVQAVLRAAELALAFRNEFQRDIILDLMGFRRWGHNETDEPSFTQPRLYAAIRQHPRLVETLGQELIEKRIITHDELVHWETESLEYLREQYQLALDENAEGGAGHAADLEGLATQNERHSHNGQRAAGTRTQTATSRCAGGTPPKTSESTGVAVETLGQILQHLSEPPPGFQIHDKLRRSQDDRRKMAQQEEPVDWATAEALALATLAAEGHRVRLAGQDSQRGTFSQRHAMLHDVASGASWSIFAGLPNAAGKVEVINSPLNEAAAMGFEYGYSLESPGTLVMWEAQFGDFANAAQVIIDQFLASAEDKWNQLNSLVLLLPHGFEGQGPEHSSGRLERFLTLVAENNFQIAQPSTPAQYFHLLRRQVKRSWFKPLVILTPKSLLRSRAARSQLSDLAEGAFEPVLAPPDLSDAKRILVCSGKIYYELEAYAEQQQREDVALVRVEEFYPTGVPALRAALAERRSDAEILWVQEEPANMGAWRWWQAVLSEEESDQHASVADSKRRAVESQFAAFRHGYCRPASASPAIGSKFIHRQEQEDLIRRAFGQHETPTAVITTQEMAS